jgi:hypothetical protein
MITVEKEAVNNKSYIEDDSQMSSCVVYPKDTGRPGDVSGALPFLGYSGSRLTILAVIVS